MGQAVYSALKPFAYPDRLAAFHSDNGWAAPVHVRIKPTNVCNHACWFCAYRNDGVSLGSGMTVRDKLPREKMLEIADDLVAMGVEAVTFSGGGEPLIYPHLVEAIERLAAGGIKIGALTNGARLKGKVADALAAHASWLRVSIDGWDGASYARYRGVKEDAFEQVMANLAAFAGRGSRCVLGASIIVDRDNASHIYELAARLKACGVSHAKISPCITSDDGAETNAYHAAVWDTVRAEITRARALDDDGFHVVDHYHEAAVETTKPYGRCPFARLLTVIGADANVYFCQDKAYTESGCLGSIADRRFADFWAAPETRARLRALDPSTTCRHHCVADAKNRLLLDYLALDRAHVAFV